MDEENYQAVMTLEGGGGFLVPFVVRGRAIFRGTFFRSVRNNVDHFHIFQKFPGIVGIIFRKFVIISGIMTQILFDLHNYGPKIHENLQNHLCQSLGQNCTSQSDDRSR